jgi:hypothetical protein
MAVARATATSAVELEPSRGRDQAARGDQHRHGCGSGRGTDRMSKDPKGTGGSNRLCSTNEALRTTGQISYTCEMGASIRPERLTPRVLQRLSFPC